MPQAQSNQVLTASSPLPCRLCEGVGSINICEFEGVGGRASLGHLLVFWVRDEAGGILEGFSCP